MPGGHLPVLDTLEGQRNQRHDNQRVVDNGGKHRALGGMQAHDVQRRQPGIQPHEQRRDDGEVFRYVVGNGEGGQTAPGHEQLLADAHNVDQLGGRGIQVHHVARFLGGLGARVHGHRHIRLGKSRRIVGAVSGHGDHMALGLQVPDHLEFPFRRRFGQEIVHSGFRRDGGRGERIVAGDHDGFDPHFAQVGELFLDAVLDDVLQVDDAQNFMVFRHHQGCAALVGDGLDHIVAFGAVGAAVLGYILLHSVRGALADLVAVKVHAAHAGGGREGNEGHPLVLQRPFADAERLFGQHHNAAAFRRLVGGEKQAGRRRPVPGRKPRPPE